MIGRTEGDLRLFERDQIPPRNNHQPPQRVNFHLPLGVKMKSNMPVPVEKLAPLVSRRHRTAGIHSPPPQVKNRQRRD